MIYPKEATDMFDDSGDNDDAQSDNMGPLPSKHTKVELPDDSNSYLSSQRANRVTESSHMGLSNLVTPTVTLLSFNEHAQRHGISTEFSTWSEGPAHTLVWHAKCHGTH
jgi:hypothetical protein